MKRQFTIFLIVSAMMAAWGLSYTSQAIANFTVFKSTTLDVSNTKIVLQPENIEGLSAEGLKLEVQDSQEIIQQRMEQLDLSVAYDLNQQDSHLEILLPRHGQTPYLLNIITRVGQIEFINGGHKLPPLGEYINTELSPAAADETYPVLFTGQEISTIKPPQRASGEIFYQFELHPEAAQRFSELTSSATRPYICLLIDKQVINCSKMYHLAANTLDILPNLDSSVGLGLTDLAIFLKSGPLPVPLEVLTH